MPRRTGPKAVLACMALVSPLLVGGCGRYAYAPGVATRITPTRVDPALTGTSTRVDPRFLGGGPNVGTGVVNQGPLYGAETGLRRN